MTDLPQRKVGVVACSGEEIAEGTISRLAALRVLGYLRPDDTVTICLPLFLAGGEEDRLFARFHPTIAIDGCSRRCAARATAMYSGKPAASVVVSDIVVERGIGHVAGRRHLNEAGRQAVKATAEQIAGAVDTLLGKTGDDRDSAVIVTPAAAELTQEGEATCACGSGIPVQNVMIEGRMVTFVALPLIMQQFRTAGKVADVNTARELLNAVRIYNQVPDSVDDIYASALLRVYAAYCESHETIA